MLVIFLNYLDLKNKIYRIKGNFILIMFSLIIF